MASAVTPVTVFLVQFSDDQPGAAAKPPPDFPETLAEEPPLPAPPDADALWFKVDPPNGADPEIIALKKDLSDAEDVLTQATKDGYVVHGEGYFAALKAGVNADPVNAYQGSQEPLLTLTPAQTGTLSAIVDKATEDERRRIDEAAASVEAFAAKWARDRLKASADLVVVTASRYFNLGGESAVRSWLEKSGGSGGAQTFVFTKAGADLVRAILALQPYYNNAQAKDSDLARAMRAAGPEMQGIDAARWKYLKKKDPKNTSPFSKTRSDSGYGVELVNPTNSARPDLVRAAEQLYPDPATVSRAAKAKIDAAAALTSALIEQAANHPILYRIWSPSLGAKLVKTVGSGDVQNLPREVFNLFELRTVMSEALRSTYAAANGLAGKILHGPALVWKFPLLIRGALDAKGLAEDDDTRIVAEHRVEAVAEAAEFLQKGAMRISEVLTVMELVIRFVPAPEFTLPAAVAIEVLDRVVGGLALLAAYFTESDTRDAYRAFLAPSDCFAASDGSFFGIIVGAAVMLFGLAGLKRTTISPPGKGEVGIAAGAIVYQEYETAKSPDAGGKGRKK